MGKPSDQAATGPSSSSPSSSSRPGPPPQRYFDDDPAELSSDNLDLPPLYEEIANQPHPEIPQSQSSNVGGGGIQPADGLLRVDFGNSDVYGRLGPAGLAVQPFSKDPRGTTEYYVDDALASDPVALEQALRALARVPPRPFAVIRGTHTETQQRGADDGGSRTDDRQVVDFDLEIEMTHLLFASGGGGGDRIDLGAHEGTRLRVVGNLDYARRGAVLRSRAPGFSAKDADPSARADPAAAAAAAAAAEAGAPSVQEWCHRFCASGAGLKALQLERRAVGFDWPLLARRLEDAVRATNYRGRVDVSFPLRGARVEVLNDCRTNRWRLTRWVVVLCSITLLFLVTWPWLWLRTKRWETLYTEWRFSWDAGEDGDGHGDPQGAGPLPARRYASMSEEAWLAMWTRPVQLAVLQRRRGQLDQRDLVPPAAAAGMDASALDGSRAQLEAMGIVNRWFGWGGENDVAGWGGDQRGRILPRFVGRRSW